MPQLTTCASCTELVVRGTCVCPHCGEKACSTPTIKGAAALLGLSFALAGCPGPGQPDYGVPDTGATTTTTGTTTSLVDALKDDSQHG